MAAKMGNTKVVKHLMKRAEILVNHHNTDGRTPLFIAAGRGNFEEVEALMGNKDIQVNQADIVGDAPLHMAALNGHGRVTKLLLDHPDINVCKANKKGKTPLSKAKKNGHIKVISLLMKKLREPLNEDSTCVVCLESRPEVVLLPCGHRNLCKPCAWRCYGTQKKCPFDRIKISKPLPLCTKTEPEINIFSGSVFLPVGEALRSQWINRFELSVRCLNHLRQAFTGQGSMET